jgi:hypothetical protein
MTLLNPLRHYDKVDPPRGRGSIRVLRAAAQTFGTPACRAGSSQARAAKAVTRPGRLMRAAWT